MQKKGTRDNKRPKWSTSGERRRRSGRGEAQGSVEWEKRIFARRSRGGNVFANERGEQGSSFSYDERKVRFRGKKARSVGKALHSSRKAKQESPKGLPNGEGSKLAAGLSKILSKGWGTKSKLEKEKESYLARLRGSIINPLSDAYKLLYKKRVKGCPGIT